VPYAFGNGSRCVDGHAAEEPRDGETPAACSIDPVAAR
jgi:hypothetical protein